MTLLTVQEVAAILKLSVLTIYKYIKEQRLEAVEFGGHYRIPEDSLEVFIRDHTVTRSKQNPVSDTVMPAEIPEEGDIYAE